MAEMLGFAKSLRLRLCGADHLRDLARNYSRCRLIKTNEARSTPTPSIPTAIWPSAMLSSVQARVVDPINSGMGGNPKIDRDDKRRCNGGGRGSIPRQNANRRRKSMPVLFVARSVKLGRWGSDVGLGKHVYKVGLADDDPKTLGAAGWAGETRDRVTLRAIARPSPSHAFCAGPSLSRSAGEGLKATPRWV